MMFLGIDTNYWLGYRRKVQLSEKQEILGELRTAEGMLTTALAFGSRGRFKLDVNDRIELHEIIDRVRNYIDHIEQEY